MTEKNPTADKLQPESPESIEQQSEPTMDTIEGGEDPTDVETIDPLAESFVEAAIEEQPEPDLQEMARHQSRIDKIETGRSHKSDAGTV